MLLAKTLHRVVLLFTQDRHGPTSLLLSRGLCGLHESNRRHTSRTVGPVFQLTLSRLFIPSQKFRLFPFSGSMAVIPPHPWLSAFYSGDSGGGGTERLNPIRAFAVASALRLGHVIRLRCTAHLPLHLCAHSPLEDYHCSSDSTGDIRTWGKYLLKKHSLLKTLADVLSLSSSSCFSFFNGNESEKNYPSKHRSQSVTAAEIGDGRLCTNVILALNVLAYVAQVTSQGKLTLWGAKVNGLIDKGQLWRLATSAFLHVNIGHLMVNCYSLNSVGPPMEQLSGSKRFIAVYFTSAIASSLMSYRYCPFPAVGASGAIFGLVGSLAVFVLRHKSILGGGKQELQEIARVIALNMVIGLGSRRIDNWGHLGGLLGGAAMSWLLGPAWKFEFQSTDGRPVVVDRPPISHFIKRTT